MIARRLPLLVLAACAHGPTAQAFTRTKDIRYLADHTTTSTTRLPLMVRPH